MRSLVLGRLAALALALAAAACGNGGAGRERCAQCGMYVDLAPSWSAGATSRSGEAVPFDAPRCLAAWARTPDGRGARDAWVTDYYDQRRIPAASAHYVIGSDVIGPMGPDFVPIAGADRAATFREDHHGTRILEFAALDPALLP